MLWLIGVLQCSYAITLVYNGIDVNVFAHMPYVPFPAEDKGRVFLCLGKKQASCIPLLSTFLPS